MQVGKSVHRKRKYVMAVNYFCSIPNVIFNFVIDAFSSIPLLILIEASWLMGISRV